MDNFTLTIDSTLHGYWGWWVSLILILALIVFFCFMRKIENEDWRYGPAVFGTILTLVFLGGNVIAYGVVTEDTRDAAIHAALSERGLSDAIEVEENLFVLTRDGQTALYTVMGEGDTLTFYQTTE